MSLTWILPAMRADIETLATPLGSESAGEDEGPGEGRS